MVTDQIGGDSGVSRFEWCTKKDIAEADNGFVSSGHGLSEERRQSKPWQLRFIRRPMCNV